MKKNLQPINIIKTIERHKEQLNRFGVKRIGLFGSFVKGTTHKKSDIDLLVLFDKPNFDNYMELKFMLEKLFHRKVDLIIEDDLKPSLKYVKDEALYTKTI